MFKPNNTLKRCEMAAIVNRVAKLCGVTTTGYDYLVKFDDTVNHWCKSELGWPYYVGIVKGTSGTNFSPENTLTTEQTIMMIYRLYKELGGSDTPKMPDSGTTTSGVRAEVKKIIDAYEKAYNEYCDCMVKYQKSNNYTDQLAALGKYEAITKATTNLDTTSFNSDEQGYYWDAYYRIMKRLAEIGE